MKHIWNLPIDTPPKTLSCKISFIQKKLPFLHLPEVFLQKSFPFFHSTPNQATPKKWDQRFLPCWNTAWCPLGGVCFHPVTSAKHNSIWSERWSKRASLGSTQIPLTHQGKPPEPFANKTATKLEKKQSTVIKLRDVDVEAFLWGEILYCHQRYDQVRVRNEPDIVWRIPTTWSLPLRNEKVMLSQKFWEEGPVLFLPISKKKSSP